MRSVSRSLVLDKASIAVLSRKWKLGKVQAESMPKGELVFTLSFTTIRTKCRFAAATTLAGALFRNGRPSRTSSGQDVILSWPDFLRWRRKVAATTNLKTRGNHVT